MIQYEFAYDSLENLININNVNGLETNRFVCLGCGNEMIAILGKKRVHHFRHKRSFEINCSPETYLHKLAKIKFYEVYQNCLENNKPFKIKILMNRVCNFYQKDGHQVCKLDPEKMEFDLTNFFNKEPKQETRENSFIPDILLEAQNGEKIFFEVYVTHASGDKKIDSKYRIIEFKIKYEHEIKIIESCLLEESDKINFFNFKKEKIKDWCKGRCFYSINNTTLDKKINSKKEAILDKKPDIYKSYIYKIASTEQTKCIEYIEKHIQSMLNYFNLNLFQIEVDQQKLEISLKRYGKIICLYKYQNTSLREIQLQQIYEKAEKENVNFFIFFDEEILDYPIKKWFINKKIEYRFLSYDQISNQVKGLISSANNSVDFSLENVIDESLIKPAIIINNTHKYDSLPNNFSLNFLNEF